MKNLSLIILAVVIFIGLTSCEKEEVTSYLIIRNEGTLPSGTYQMTAEGFSYVAVSKVVNISFYEEHYQENVWAPMPTYSCGNGIREYGDTITVKSPNPNQLVRIDGEIIVL